MQSTLNTLGLLQNTEQTKCHPESTALYDMCKGCCSYPSAITETKTRWPFQQTRKLRTLTSVLPPPFSPSTYSSV